MTQMPSPALPPSSTSNYSARSVGASLQAKRKVATQPVQEGRTGDIAKVASLYRAPAVKVAKAWPTVTERPERTMRLSELAAMVSRAKNHKKVVAESRDPDGPDTGGYDPSEIVRSMGSSAGTAARVVGAMLRRGR